jgi:MoCo/4Fe-4S cofactor protein with predicted Tat translocation signal
MREMRMGKNSMAETQIPFGNDNQRGVQVVNAIAPAKLTLAEVRAKLEGKSGKRYWKSLDELADTPAFQELMQEEFPRQAGAGEWVDSVSRRGFLKVMGASFALAGLAGCTKQPDVLCYGASVPDGGDSGAGEVGCVPADQAGGQSGTPDVEGEERCVYAGLAAGFV